VAVTGPKFGTHGMSRPSRIHGMVIHGLSMGYPWVIQYFMHIPMNIHIPFIVHSYSIHIPFIFRSYSIHIDMPWKFDRLRKPHRVN
jgi:hypothetical protein